MYSKPNIQRKAPLPSTVIKRSLVENAHEKEDSLLGVTFIPIMLRLT